MALRGTRPGRPLRTLGRVRSYVIRLVDEAVERGELLGQVEVVETGESTTVRNIDELLAVFGLRP